MAKLKISVFVRLFSFYVAIGVALSAAAPFAIKVKAEDVEPTYTEGVSGECYSFKYGNYSSDIVKFNYTSDYDVRLTILTASETGRRSLYIVSQNSFVYGRGSSSACAAVPSNNTASGSSGGVTFYYVVYSIGYYPNYDYGIPINIDSDPNASSRAYYYTFGDGSVGPEPPEPDPNPDLLGLKNLRYTTRIVGHGTQGYQNIDEITWDPGRDLGENFLVGGTVQIRAVSGKYAALTYDGLKALSIGDFSFVGNPVVLADDIVATVGSFSVTWQTVFNSLTILSANLKAYQDTAGYWNREGWAYQYRYKLDNSTTTTGYSQWFTVYTFTSASGDSTVGLDNNLVAQPGSDGLYNNVVDSFNDINTINADIANNYNTNNYYYIDNNQYLINPDTTQQNTDQQSTWDQFTYKFHEYHDSEDLLINDMNNAIEDLTPSADLNRNNNFLNAANWVKVQFDRMTLNTPMELIIIFSLTLGFGLLLIGRFK